MKEPKILLLATIDGIKAEGNYDESDQIDQYYFFSNDPAFVAEQIADETENVRKQIGEFNFQSILRSRATVFLQQPFTDLHVLSKFLGKHPVASLLQAFRSRLLPFVHFLWLVKDSSASVGNIYCIFPHSVAEGDPNIFCLGCKGNMAPVTFQREEIKSAVNTMASYRTSLKAQKFSTPNALKFTDTFTSEFSADKSRLSKALLMLQVVRQTEDIGLKIAHYCSCFEILFNSPDDMEGISHKLAERMTFFLSSSVNERVNLYEAVREAYRVRCEVFHGKFLKPGRQAQLEQICVKCDELLRETLCRILKSPEFAALFTDKPEKFDRHFRDLIFRAYET